MRNSAMALKEFPCVILSVEITVSDLDERRVFNMACDFCDLVLMKEEEEEDSLIKKKGKVISFLFY